MNVTLMHTYYRKAANRAAIGQTVISEGSGFIE